MGNLIKMDMLRARKDVLLKVMLIVGAAFALTTPLLYWLMVGDMDAETMAMMDMMGGFTLIRLTGMVGTMGINFTKEQLLDMNAKLNKIKAPKRK